MEQLYRRLLGLYPAQFRAAFAPEMSEIFRTAYSDAVQRGRTREVRFLLREILGLCTAIPREHLAAHSAKPANQREQIIAAWIVRSASLNLTFFFLNVALHGENGLAQALIEIAMQIPLLVGAILAWKNLRRGGLFVMVGAVLNGLVLTLYLASFLPSISAFALLGGLLWCLPQLLFGGMLLHLATPPQITIKEWT